MHGDVRNLFVDRSAAARYAAARPYFHPVVVQRVAAFAGQSRFQRALDVGCGTGQSARALAEICDGVDAVDVSSQMIAEAAPHPRVRYGVASAESLPFSDCRFDLVTAGLSFHWFDQARFLDETCRVLRPGGWLVIYNHAFTGTMCGNPSFVGWHDRRYLLQFPPPPRHATRLDEGAFSPHGLQLCAREEFATEEVMHAEALTEYLLTQSNTIGAIASGTTTLDAARAWIATGVSPYFGAGPGVMQFRGTISYARRPLDGASSG